MEKNTRESKFNMGQSTTELLARKIDSALYYREKGNTSQSMEVLISIKSIVGTRFTANESEELGKIKASWEKYKKYGFPKDRYQLNIDFFGVGGKYYGNMKTVKERADIINKYYKAHSIVAERRITLYNDYENKIMFLLDKYKLNLPDKVSEYGMS